MDEPEKLQKNIEKFLMPYIVAQAALEKGSNQGNVITQKVTTFFSGLCYTMTESKARKKANLFYSQPKLSNLQAVIK